MNGLRDINGNPDARPARAYEHVTRILLRQIIRGTIPVGTKLPTERALAAKFQVNRATVREALRYLENLGLVAIRQGDGAYACHFLDSANLETAKALMHVDAAMQHEVLGALLEVRRINSPEVAYVAARRRTTDHLQQLEEAAFNRHESPVMERDKAVHRIIGQASGNILQVLMTNFFEDFFDQFGHFYFQNDRNIRRSEAFHSDIYYAIRDQRAGVAREIMRDVLHYAEEAVFMEIDRAPLNTRASR